jgi:hypothetical protein
MQYPKNTLLDTLFFHEWGRMGANRKKALGTKKPARMRVLGVFCIGTNYQMVEAGATRKQRYPHEYKKYFIFKLSIVP